MLLSWLENRKLLHHAQAQKIALIAAALLSLPTVWAGFFADDHIHRSALSGNGEFKAMPAWDLFRFASGSLADNQIAIDTGHLTWWSTPDLKLGFFRPLSTAFHHVDHALFHDAPWLQHVHSIAWYLVAIALLGAIYRRVLPGAAGGLALILFALDDAHGLPAGWIANRNAVIATTFGLLAILLHVKARTEKRFPNVILAPIALIAALLSGEASLGAAVYLGAFEIAGANDRWATRARALAPYAVIAIAYVAVQKALGYGAHGSGVYLDPRDAPLAWLGAVIPRSIALAGGALFNAPIDAWALAPQVIPPLVISSAALIVLFGFFARAVWPELRQDERASFRWLALGSALSMIPLSSTFPASRLLLLPGVGAFGAMSLLLVAAARKVELARAWRRFATTLLVIHGVLTVPAWALIMPTMFSLERAVDQTSREIEIGDPPPDLVVTLFTPDPFSALYVHWTRLTLGLPMAPHVMLVSMAPYDHEVRRIDDRTLDMRVVGGAMLGTTFEALFRDMRTPFYVGERRRSGQVWVEVTEVIDGRPSRLKIEFPVPLDDPSMRVVVWRDRGLRKFNPPEVGETLLLKNTGGLLELVP